MSMRTVAGWFVIIAFVVLAGFLFARYWQSSPAAEPALLTASNSFKGLQPSASSVIVRDNQEASPSPATSATPLATVSNSPVEIAISDVDFSPAEVVVPIGTKVTFVNNGQGTHWPESSEFGAKRELQTGETFSYVFTRAGTYAYKDRQNSNLKGTIIVK